MSTTLLAFLAMQFLVACKTGTDKEDVTGTDEGLPNLCDEDPSACDEDGDGFRPSEGDCDDGNAEVYPGATEACDGRDQDCDGEIDEGVTTTFYQDFDQDGFGNPDQATVACEAPEGYIENGTDCDDAQDQAFPGNAEICDEIDNDCDTVVDNGVTTRYFADADADTFGDPNTFSDECEQPTGTVLDNTDCDDSNGRSFPGNVEICDEIDNDCDAVVDEDVQTTYFADIDGDNFGDPAVLIDACAPPTGYVADNTDCDDSRTAVNPGATELCNTIDDDCDAEIDENTAADASTWYIDADTDTYGNPAISEVACYQPSGYVADNTDCDDARTLSNPAATEYCNTFDDNCNGSVDEDAAVDASTWYIDADSDLYGNASVSDVACYQPSGYVADNTDCNDGSNRAYPGATEYCDTLDNNCDGSVDEDTAVDATTWYADADNDRYGNPAVSDVECYQPSGYVTDNTDCDDARAESYPGATEYCNTYDDDCDGTVDEDTSVDALTWYQDLDADTFGNVRVTDIECYQPSGYVADSTDCDDARALTNPAATEFCNSIDDDCDGTIDEDAAADAVTWYQDRDLDGYGNPSVSDVSCAAPSGYVLDNTDCLDTSAISYPGATEICDSLDNDCDGTVDDNPSDGTTYYADSDSDGFGDPSSTTSECSMPTGYIDNWYDCNDSDSGEPRVADISLGSSSGTGSLANPYFAIQDAIDAADECVLVYPGTYNEQLDLDGKSIDLWGIEGADTTIVDANLSTCSSSNPTACGAAMVIDSGSGASPTIHGLSLTGGTGKYTSSTTTTTCADSSSSHSGRNTCTVTTFEYCGGGVYVNGDDPYFYDTIVRDNILPDFEQATIGSYTQYWLYSYGGGVCLRNSNATFETTMIEGNYADQGGGMFAEDSSSFSFESGMVSENDATDGGGVNLSGASAAFTNAAFACNAASTDGGALYTETSGTASYTNTAFFNNTSSTSGTARGAAAYVSTSTTFNLYNSVVQASTSVYAIYGAGGSGTQSYNNVYNNPGSGYGGTLSAGTGAISSGSNFTSVGCDGNAYNDDFSLRSTSASINAGDPSTSFNDADGTRNNMGAFGGPGSLWSL